MRPPDRSSRPATALVVTPLIPSAHHSRLAHANGAPAMSEPERPRRRHVLPEAFGVKVSTHMGRRLLRPQGRARARAGT